MYGPLVSVIIPTKNSGKTLEGCLKSIKDQIYKNIEIIVVDNNSIDRTKEIAMRYTEQVYNKGPERSSQRNLGSKNAKGEYLLFVDSDMELAPEVVEECMEKIHREKAHAIIIPEISIGEGFWAKCRSLEKRCYVGDDTIEAARFFERKIFFKFDGYDEEIAGGGEEWDLPFRIKKTGYKIDRINAVVKHHEGKINPWSSMKKKYYYGQTINKYFEKHPDIAKKQFIILRPAFIRNRIMLFNDPGHMLGMFFMKFCEFVAGGAGIIKKRLSYTKALSREKRSQRGVLMITPFFSPNIGGLETHLDDLCSYLDKKEYSVDVITYQPLTTQTKGLRTEIIGNIKIKRLSWFGHNWFYKLGPYPALELIYLFPAILSYSFYFLLKNDKKVDVIHAHGLIAAFVTWILSKFFKKRIVLSTHTFYDFKNNSVTRNFFKRILPSFDKISCLSNQSKRELIGMGMDSEKIEVYTYWVNQEIFKPLDKIESKNKLNLENKFNVLFVGRLIKVKGVLELLEVARKFTEKNGIIFTIVGTGPLEKEVIRESLQNKNINFSGKIENKVLPIYYNAADVLVVPSQYEEGFGRVLLEALSCGIPVIASDRGGIKESIKESVGVLIDPRPDEIYRIIKFLHEYPDELKKMAGNARRYALERFSESNAKIIENIY